MGGLRGWGGGQTSTVLYIKIKGNDACSTMVVNILHVHTFSTPGLGSKGKNIILMSEISHIAYQMKQNGAWSTMQAHILTAPVLGSKHFFSLKVVMLHIKLKGKERRGQCKYIFNPYAHTLPVGVGSKVLF